MSKIVAAVTIVLLIFRYEKGSTITLKYCNFFHVIFIFCRLYLRQPTTFILVATENYCHMPILCRTGSVESTLFCHIVPFMTMRLQNVKKKTAPKKGRSRILIQMFSVQREAVEFSWRGTSLIQRKHENGSFIQMFFFNLDVSLTKEDEIRISWLFS